MEQLKGIVDPAMEVEAAEYGDEASKQFYQYLKAKKFKTTQCKDCKNVALPPRMFCPECFGADVEWVTRWSYHAKTIEPVVAKTSYR